jgi:hypothetical protein
MMPGNASAAEWQDWIEPNYSHIDDFYVIDDVVFLAPIPHARFAEVGEYDPIPYTLTYRIEVWKNCEPDIREIKAQRYGDEGWEAVKLTPEEDKLAREYLEDNHERWIKLRDHMRFHGRRIPYAEAA